MPTVTFGTPVPLEPETTSPENLSSEPVDKVNPVTTLATTKSKSPALLSDALRAKFASMMEGDIESTDIKKVFLGIVQGTGPMVRKLGYGTWHYAGEHSLGKDPIKLVFCPPARKYFLEDPSDEQRKQDPNRIPKKFKELAVAIQQGFSLDAERGDNKIVRAALLDVFLVLPASHPLSENASFTVKNEKTGIDESYIEATWNVKKGAYQTVVGTLNRDLSRWLKGDYRNGFYEVAIVDKAWEKNTWVEPTMKAAGRVPAEILAQIKGEIE
jgi:hypothetical protein